jgi:hypothetical protein
MSTILKDSGDLGIVDLTSGFFDIFTSLLEAQEIKCGIFG